MRFGCFESKVIYTPQPSSTLVLCIVFALTQIKYGSVTSKMAAEDVHQTGKCKRFGDAGQQQRIMVTKADEETAFPHRVRDVMLLLVG